MIASFLPSLLGSLPADVRATLGLIGDLAAGADTLGPPELPAVLAELVNGSASNAGIAPELLAAVVHVQGGAGPGWTVERLARAATALRTLTRTRGLADGLRDYCAPAGDAAGEMATRIAAAYLFLRLRGIDRAQLSALSGVK